MKEKIITCIQCGRSFVFTVSEQEDFIKKGFDKPKRCSPCRKKKSKAVDSQWIEKQNGKKKYFRRKYET